MHLTLSSRHWNRMLLWQYRVKPVVEEKGYLLPTLAWKIAADVLTECSSRHQGKSEEVWTNVGIYSHALLRIHRDDDWSIQSKHQQVIFRAKDNLSLHLCRSQLRSHWKHTIATLYHCLSQNQMPLSHTSSYSLPLFETRSDATFRFRISVLLNDWHPQYMYTHCQLQRANMEWNIKTWLVQRTMISFVLSLHKYLFITLKQPHWHFYIYKSQKSFLNENKRM